MVRLLWFLFSTFQSDSTMCPENLQRQSPGDFCGPILADTAMVYPTDGADISRPIPTTTRHQYAQVTSQTSSNSPLVSQVEDYHLQTVRRGLGDSGISRKATRIILESWRNTTKQQYGVYIKKWAIYCSEGKIYYFQPSVAQVLDFLVELFDNNLGYSAINTAHCALSSFISIGTVTIGAHPLVIRFLKNGYITRDHLFLNIWRFGIHLLSQVF